MKNGKKNRKTQSKWKIWTKKIKKVRNGLGTKIGKIVYPPNVTRPNSEPNNSKNSDAETQTVAETQVREYRYRSNMTGILITIDKIQKIITYSNSKR